MSFLDTSTNVSKIISLVNSQQFANESDPNEMSAKAEGNAVAALSILNASGSTDAVTTAAKQKLTDRIHKIDQAQSDPRSASMMQSSGMNDSQKADALAQSMVTGSDLHMRINSDGTLEGSANGSAIKGDLGKDGSASAVKLANVQLGNTMKGEGGKWNQEYSGTVDGKSVNVQSNGYGEIKLTVDGKELKPGESSGSVVFDKGGPGDCGIVRIAGKDVNGKSVNMKITKDITEDHKKENARKFGLWEAGPIGWSQMDKVHNYNHNGLTLEVDGDAGNGATRIGGDVGKAANPS